MPLSLLLLISLGAFALVASVLARSEALRRRLLRRRAVEAVLAGSVLASGASYFVTGSGASGTGLRTSHGFPKPFYFTWQSWEHPSVSYEGINWLYFVGNCIGWLAALSLAATLVAALAAARQGPRFGGRSA